MYIYSYTVALIVPLGPALHVISLLDVEAQSVHDQPLALMEMIFRIQASISQISPLPFQIGTITLAAHAEGVAPLLMILLNSRARTLSPRCTSSFHTSAGMSSGPRAFLFFIFLMASSTSAGLIGWFSALVISRSRNSSLHVESKYFFQRCKVKVKVSLFVTYTIIQGIISSEM